VTTPDPGRMVAALAADLEALRRDVTTVRSAADSATESAATANRTVVDVKNQITGLRTDFAAVAALGPQVQALADQIAEVAAAGGESGGPKLGGPPSWFEADPTTAAGLLQQLAHWLRDVGSRYKAIGEPLTDCWYRHPPVVDALNSAFWAWQGAYQDRAARPATAADWHIRILPGIDAILRRELNACSEQQHGPEGEYTRKTKRMPEPDTDRLDLYARWFSETGGRGDEPDVRTRPGRPGAPKA
jgi:hypothetical protein